MTISQARSSNADLAVAVIGIKSSQETIMATMHRHPRHVQVAQSSRNLSKMAHRSPRLTDTVTTPSRPSLSSAILSETQSVTQEADKNCYESWRNNQLLHDSLLSIMLPLIRFFSDFSASPEELEVVHWPPGQVPLLPFSTDLTKIRSLRIFSHRRRAIPILCRLCPQIDSILSHR